MVRQSFGLRTRLDLIRQHPKKGLILLLSLSAYICVSVYQVCVILPDIRFLPSNTVLHVVTMTLPSVHLSNEKTLCQLLPFNLKRGK